MTDLELLREAAELLDLARCSALDPSVRRSWGQRRRRLLDAISARSTDG